MTVKSSINKVSSIRVLFFIFLIFTKIECWPIFKQDPTILLIFCSLEPFIWIHILFLKLKVEYKKEMSSITACQMASYSTKIKKNKIKNHLRSWVKLTKLWVSLHMSDLLRNWSLKVSSSSWRATFSLGTLDTITYWNVWRPKLEAILCSTLILSAWSDTQKIYNLPKDYFITGRANVIFCAVGLR